MTAACATLVALWPAFAADAPPRRLPIEAFSALPAMRSPHLSPDGTKIAYLKDYNGRATVAVLDLTGKSPQIVMPADKWLIDDLVWASNDRLILLAGFSTRSDFTYVQLQTFFRAISISADGEKAVGMLADNDSMPFNTSAARIVDLTIDEPGSVLMPLFVEGTGRYGFRNELYQVDLTTGRGQAVAHGGGDTIDWYTDGAGNVVARLDQSPEADRLMVNRGGTWTEGLRVDAAGGRGIAVAGLSEDGKALMLWGESASGQKGLERFDLATGPTNHGLGVQGYDVAEAIADEWTGRIVGVSYLADRPEALYTDNTLRALQKGLEKFFPGNTIEILSHSRDNQRYLLSVEGPRSPPAYYIFDMGPREVEAVGNAYPNIAATDLGEEKPWPYKARDGLAIHAYLTLPPGKPAKNLPLIVMPHGGPDERDFLTFDWWAQFLANRGYAVLQPNFRGSSGYGRGFTEAGLQQWGLKMQDDVSDGVRKAIADGIADPKRVCIVGASYGGYAALAGATLTPDLYACAVSVAGVSDLPKMLSYERRQFGGSSREYLFWRTRIGSQDDDDERLRATSPARLAANVRCPILLLHGENDTTVQIQQSEIMEEALKDAGKPVSLVRFEGDDHYLQLSATRTRMLGEIEKFLAANIGN